MGLLLKKHSFGTKKQSGQCMAARPRSIQLSVIGHVWKIRRDGTIWLLELVLEQHWRQGNNQRRRLDFPPRRIPASHVDTRYRHPIPNGIIISYYWLEYSPNRLIEETPLLQWGWRSVSCAGSPLGISVGRKEQSSNLQSETIFCLLESPPRNPNPTGSTGS